MIYPAIDPARYKAGMETGSISPALASRKASAGQLPTRDTFSAQTPLVVIGLAAIGLIFLINSHARPTPTPERVAVVTCAECGTVVGVRRAADPTLSYVIEIQMLDGSFRTTRQSTAGFNVGDIVQIRGNFLTLRSAAS
ncbi:MAG: hypothetical protein ABJA83_03430 [Burkholderiaceae bacterium]